MRNQLFPKICFCDGHRLWVCRSARVSPHCVPMARLLFDGRAAVALVLVAVNVAVGGRAASSDSSDASSCAKCGYLKGDYNCCNPRGSWFGSCGGTDVDSVEDRSWNQGWFVCEWARNRSVTPARKRRLLTVYLHRGLADRLQKIVGTNHGHGASTAVFTVRVLLSRNTIATQNTAGHSQRPRCWPLAADRARRSPIRDRRGKRVNVLK